MCVCGVVSFLVEFRMSQPAEGNTQIDWVLFAFFVGTKSD